jgi:hypothetical protein
MARAPLASLQLEKAVGDAPTVTARARTIVIDRHRPRPPRRSPAPSRQSRSSCDTSTERENLGDANHSAAPSGPARAAGGRRGRARKPLLWVGVQTGTAAPAGGRDRPWVRRRRRAVPAAAPRPARARRARGTPRRAPSPRPGSGAVHHSGHTRARQTRTPAGATGPRASTPKRSRRSSWNGQAVHGCGVAVGRAECARDLQTRVRPGGCLEVRDDEEALGVPLDQIHRADQPLPTIAP